MEQRLIDANALLNSSFRITGSWELSNGRKQDFESIPVQEITTAPTIDPVHAAGGCYCRECEFSDDCDKQATLRAYDPILELHKTSYYRLEWCSYGKPRKESHCL